MSLNQVKDLELLARIRRQDLYAYEELVACYLPLVRHIALRGHVPYDDCDDLLQEGTIGLLSAIRAYQPEKYQVKFSTFAYLCIRRRVLNIRRTGKIAGAFSFVSAEEDGLCAIPDRQATPEVRYEDSWAGERLTTVLASYLSPVEHQVVTMLVAGYNLQEIHQCLSLGLKVVDNARTRAKAKIKKVLYEYGSLLNPSIPAHISRRRDLYLHPEYLGRPS